MKCGGLAAARSSIVRKESGGALALEIEATCPAQMLCERIPTPLRNFTPTTFLVSGILFFNKNSTCKSFFENFPCRMHICVHFTEHCYLEIAMIS